MWFFLKLYILCFGCFVHSLCFNLRVSNYKIFIPFSICIKVQGESFNWILNFNNSIGYFMIKLSPCPWQNLDKSQKDKLLLLYEKFAVYNLSLLFSKGHSNYCNTSCQRTLEMSTCLVVLNNCSFIGWDSPPK